MTKHIAASLGLLAIFALTACNTTAGAGKDVSATGKVITKEADKLKP